MWITETENGWIENWTSGAAAEDTLIICETVFETLIYRMLDNKIGWLKSNEYWKWAKRIGSKRIVRKNIKNWDWIIL